MQENPTFHKIIGVGIDIVENKRIQEIISDINSCKLLFHKSEIEYCYKYKNYLERFSGFFACKEAILKSLNCKISFLDIKIKHSKDGSPFADISNEKFFKKNISLKVSISHEKNYSTAFAIAFEVHQQT